MLMVIRSARELRFGQLMDVYEETNRKNGGADRAVALAEQDFYDYLTNCFFKIPGARYCVWQADGRYVSALRLEPWRDGLLLTALETAPQRRNQGHACAFLRSVLTDLREQGSVRVYSHIAKDNAPSIAVHEKCGFRRILDFAACLDGSVDPRWATYLCE